MNEAIAADAWRAFPDTYAEARSDGLWRPYQHLVMLADVVSAAVRKGSGRVIVSMPPRHGKSEFCSVWLPQWYLDLYPDKRVILTSYGAELATGFARRVRDGLQVDQWDQDEWSPQTEMAPGSKAAHRFSTTEGGGMVAAGVGGPITGKGGDLIIIDDPIKNWEEAQSPTIRQKVKDWFNSTLYTRAEPGSTILVIMTRWHEDDLAGWLEAEHADDWQIVRMDALCDQPESDPLGREHGEALCPERYDTAQLAKIRAAVGPKTWSALFQQRPSPGDGDVFKREWFRVVDVIPSEFDELIQSWDMTFGSKSESASYAVGAIWGRKGADIYRLDERRGRWSFTEAKEQVRAMSAEWPGAYTKLMEDKANGPAIIDELESEVGGFIRVSPDGGKYARAVAASPAFESGNVKLPRGAPWLDEYILELTQFPNGTNDDRVDETSQAVRRFRGGATISDWYD